MQAHSPKLFAQAHLRKLLLADPESSSWSLSSCEFESYLWSKLPASCSAVSSVDQSSSSKLFGQALSLSKLPASYPAVSSVVESSLSKLIAQAYPLSKLPASSLAVSWFVEAHCAKLCSLPLKKAVAEEFHRVKLWDGKVVYKLFFRKLLHKLRLFHCWGTTKLSYIEAA